jgi:hypothetical protein
MFKRFIIVFLVLVAFLLPAGHLLADGEVTLPKDRMFLGIYDPNADYDGVEMDVQEEFFHWTDIEGMRGFLGWSIHHDRYPILAIRADETFSGESSVLIETALRANDHIVMDLVNLIKEFAPQEIAVRWAYEMDLDGLNPWCQGKPTEFIAAYRHIVDLFRKNNVTNVKWMWSPAGNEGAPLYYPGDAYVDYVGFTLLASDAWDRQFHSPPQSFRRLIEIRMKVLASFGKPMVVAEFGIARPSQAQRKVWLAAALADLKSGRYPLLVGIVYLNFQNPQNPITRSNPDWRLTPENFWKPSDMPKLAK